MGGGCWSWGRWRQAHAGCSWHVQALASVRLGPAQHSPERGAERRAWRGGSPWWRWSRGPRPACPQWAGHPRPACRPDSSAGCLREEDAAGGGAGPRWGAAARACASPALACMGKSASPPRPAPHASWHVRTLARPGAVVGDSDGHPHAALDSGVGINHNLRAGRDGACVGGPVRHRAAQRSGRSRHESRCQQGAGQAPRRAPPDLDGVGGDGGGAGGGRGEGVRARLVAREAVLRCK